ncbi:FeoA family protein [Clostridium massiliamazoniense]|uniref:FeoA family protein n=1 Tax=Clostridium massiliamazoniense TaxID=1347366 RepID=UPI0006D7E2FA|nr:ferrous iron transport protein A [Clostridium massiliamazoniense]
METLDMKFVGDKVKVKNLTKESSLRKRLLDMGITPKVELQITGKAPMGDPIEVQIRGYKLILRKSEAKAIIVE